MLSSMPLRSFHFYPAGYWAYWVSELAWVKWLCLRAQQHCCDHRLLPYSFGMSPAKRDKGLMTTHTHTLAEEWQALKHEWTDRVWGKDVWFSVILLFLLDCQFVFISFPLLYLPHAHLWISTSSRTHTLQHAQTHSTRCGMTLPIYPEGGGLIEIYNDYRETKEEYFVAA